jgi:hypothetical protein
MFYFLFLSSYRKSWKGLDKLDAGAFALNGYLNLCEKNLSWQRKLLRNSIGELYFRKTPLIISKL